MIIDKFYYCIYIVKTPTIEISFSFIKYLRPYVKWSCYWKCPVEQHWTSAQIVTFSFTENWALLSLWRPSFYFWAIFNHISELFWALMKRFELIILIRIGPPKARCCNSKNWCNMSYLFIFISKKNLNIAQGSYNGSNPWQFEIWKRRQIWKRNIYVIKAFKAFSQTFFFYFVLVCNDK